MPISRAAEGAESGIRAITIAPGVVDTPLHRSMMPNSIEPVDGKSSVFQPADVARVVREVIDGVHDAFNGWVLAMPAPAAVDAVSAWVDSHPGGGVKIVQ